MSRRSQALRLPLFMHSLVGFVFFVLLFQVSKCESVCKSVNCCGQAVCHEISFPCINGTESCFLKLPQCSDKSIDDYAKDLLTSKNVQENVNKPGYLNSDNKDVLCEGFNCYGLNTCIIIRVSCVDNPSCINYQPFCDDSPIH